MKSSPLRGRVPALVVLLLAAGGRGELRASDPSLGPEFRVNTYTPDSQYAPAVARAGAGGFVLVWTSAGGDGSSSGVSGRRYTASGQPTGDDFPVNTVTASYQNAPTVAGGGDGRFLVAWESFATAPTTIAGRRFDANGAPVGAEFAIGQSSNLGNVSDPSAAAIPGGYLVAWRDWSDGSIRARLLDGNLTPVGGSLTVNGLSPGQRNNPAAGGSSAGVFVVAWDLANGDGDGTSVEAAALDAGGALLWGPERVNAITAGSQAAPAVAVDSAGGWVIAWEGPDGDQQGIWARRFGPSGPLGDEFRVNDSTTGNQRKPAISMSAGGDFVVAWQADTPQTTMTDVHFRRFLANGTPAAGETRLNTYVGGNQLGPRLARTGDDALVAAWASAGSDGSQFGVAARYGCLRGDANASGLVDVSDVFYLINHLFAGGPAPQGCADVNGDGLVDVADIFYLVNHLFAGGPAPV